MDLGLAGKTAIVTGGASNIGHGIVLAFAREGANVVIADIDQPQAERTAQLAEKLGVKALAVNTDVTKPEQAEAMAARALERFGGIDVLVNNAGIGPGAHGYFRAYKREDALRCMDLNFWGTFNCIKAVIEPMIARGSGSIVNISSGAYLGGVAHTPIYSAAKAAVVTLSQCLALEFGPHGIRVNAVAPGRVLPAAAEQVGEASSKYRPRLNEVNNDEANAAAAAAQDRLGHPDDIAATGKVLSADGGARTAPPQQKLAATQQAWAAHR